MSVPSTTAYDDTKPEDSTMAPGGQGATDTEKASAPPPRVDGGLRGWLTVLGG